MPYTALPDMRMPYDDDGSVYALGSLFDGILNYPSGSQALHANGSVYGTAGAGGAATASVVGYRGAWLFFPELREVTAFYAWFHTTDGASSAVMTASLIEGSTNSTNGLDGTWETASVGGAPTRNNNFDWRSTIKSLSFTGSKKIVRLCFTYNWAAVNVYLLHVYGEKGSGQTPDDIIYIDHDTTPGVEYTAPEDFGDRPLATTVTRQFRVKNTSATLTANTINIQCNDADFAISTDNTTWVVTINIASLGPGAESSTMYIRNTTPAPGALLGPRFARIVTTVGSWT